MTFILNNNNNNNNTPKQAVSYALVPLYARGLVRCVCDNGVCYFTSISVWCHRNYHSYTVDDKFWRHKTTMHVVYAGGNAVEINTEADSTDMTECPYDDKPRTGMFAFPDSKCV